MTNASMETASTTSPAERSTGVLFSSPWLMLFPATLLSFLFSGYVPVFNNNVYHLPILLQSYDLPQFQDDAFIQSLRHFSSGFWLVFAGAGRHVDPIIFLTGWLIVTHFAFIAACLHLAESLGYRDNRQLNLFVLLLSVSSLTVGLTVGGGGLMLDNFTHSELANATMIFGFSFALRRRYGYAAVATCATFFLNAFMAVWMVLPLILLVAHQLSSGELSVGRLLTDGVVGSLLGAVLLAPPLINIIGNPEMSAPLDFSYRDHLWSSFPSHFFLNGVPLRELIKLAGLMLILLLTVNLHGRKSREFLMLALGAIAVLAIGAIVPLLTDSRMILNLHLIRSAVMVAILAAVSLALVASGWLLSPADPMQKRFGPILTGILIAPVQISPLAVLALGYSKLPIRFDFLGRFFSDGFLRRLALLFLGLCVLVLPVRIWFVVDRSLDRLNEAAVWERVGDWARNETEPEASFLLFDKHGEGPELGFGYRSMRENWIGAKYSAAIMWSPSYHAIWESRKGAFRLPATTQERFAYAEREAAVDYLAMPCVSDAPTEPLYRDDGLCVYRITDPAK